MIVVETGEEVNDPDPGVQRGEDQDPDQDQFIKIKDQIGTKDHGHKVKMRKPDPLIREDPIVPVEPRGTVGLGAEVETGNKEEIPRGAEVKIGEDEDHPAVRALLRVLSVIGPTRPTKF